MKSFMKKILFRLEKTGQNIQKETPEKTCGINDIIELYSIDLADIIRYCLKGFLPAYKACDLTKGIKPDKTQRLSLDQLIALFFPEKDKQIKLNMDALSFLQKDVENAWCKLSEATMNLYLISQDKNTNPNTYGSAIVAARSKNDARKIHPDKTITRAIEGVWMSNYIDNVFFERKEFGTQAHLEWVKPNELGCLKVEFLCDAWKIERGVVLASYNAG